MRTDRRTGFLMLPAAALKLLLCAAGASAATYTVDTTSDAALSACLGAVANDCSLRGAMITANQTPEADTIAFDIPQSDPGFQVATQHWRILVHEPQLIPAANAPVIIDGYTQPGAVANSNTPGQGGLNTVLKIEIRGVNPIGNANFAIQLSGEQASVVRGLAINNYRDAQVYLSGNGAHRIEGCFLGTDITGSSAQLLSNGIFIAGGGPYVIGGLLPAQRNLVSGLNNALLTNQPANGVTIQGNLFGTNAAGTAAIGNEFGLLLYRMSNSLVGGSDPAARNVFSGHRSHAILLQTQVPGSFSGTRIEGNYFGTDVTGLRRLGNDINGGRSTIQANDPGCQISIGGAGPGQANLIAFSAGAGIRNDRCNGLQTPLNHYYGNQGIAFDNVFGGGGHGATPNDAGDGDELGGNRLQNYPELVLPSGGDVANLQFRVDTAPANASYPILVNFYRGACGGGSRALLASASVSVAQAQQLISFTVTSPDGAGILPLTATAVDAAGNTSEFAPMLGEALFRDEFEDTPAPQRPGTCSSP
ncbi:MAG TPA: hypothetical protein VN259_01500 [Xanthomonadales bacterium]|nr:hypothetical protein [Xanthomonadales bacterium]